MASIPCKQPGTMQLAVQLGGALFISYKFGLLINSGRGMPLMLPRCLRVVFELRIICGVLKGPRRHKEMQK